MQARTIPHPWTPACVLLLALAPAALGHGNEDMDAARLTVLTWASAIASGDAQTMASILHDDFTGPNGAPKAGYLTAVGQQAFPVGGPTLRHAYYETTESGMRVAPVVVKADSGAWLMAWALELRKEDGKWLLAAVRNVPELPPEALPGDLPEHHALQDVRVRLRDAVTGEPVAARVHVRGADGEAWPPRGHQKNIPLGWRRDVGGDVRVEEKTFAYVEDGFVVPVPPGSYVLEAHRGMEYVPVEVPFEVTGGDVLTVDVSLSRWVHMAAEGWYSGDTHVHFLTPPTAYLEGRGEDLNVVNVLATRWGELITDVGHFTGAPSVHSDGSTIVYVNEESRHSFLGHTILLKLKELVYPLTWGGPTEGVAGGYDYPPMAHQADRTHAQGGHVTWAHFPFPNGEVAIDVALGKVDSVDLMTWGDAFAEAGFVPGLPGAADTYYRFLNCGFRLPATAGTDKMWNHQVTGSVRVYAKVDGAFSYDAWIAAIRAGRTFTTTGPMLSLSAGGHGLGEVVAARAGEKVAVRAAVSSRLPVDWIEIVEGGEVVARRDNEDGARKLVLEAEVAVSESSWIAARAYAPGPLPYQTMAPFGILGIPNHAHTSPIYLEVDGRPATSSEDAAYFVGWCDKAIAWARDTARFLDESERREMIELFENAKAVYLEQVE